MSEKFKNVQRKVTEGLSLLTAFFQTILSYIVIVAIIFLLVVIIRGVIISVCWNVAMTTMFGFQNITIFQAFVLSYTIGSLRTNYISATKSEYTKINDKFSTIFKKEKISKILSAVFIVSSIAISILINIWVVMYSWNNILPNLLNLELYHIDFVQAFCFAFLFNLFFRNSETVNMNSKNKDKNSDNTIQTEATEDITENV